MSPEINAAMEKEIQNRLNELAGYELDSEKYATAVESLEKLYNQRTNEYKAESEFYIKDRELSLKERELDQNDTHKLFDVVVKNIEVVLPLAFYGSWMKKCLKFEETGTFTSSVTRSIISKIKGK